jgi:hypothetical protein
MSSNAIVCMGRTESTVPHDSRMYDSTIVEGGMHRKTSEQGAEFDGRVGTRIADQPASA